MFIVKRQTWVLWLSGATLVLLGGLAWWRLAWALLALGATVWGALLLAWSTPEKDLPAPPAQPSLTPEELHLEEIIAGNALLETTMESMREVMLAVDRKQYVVASNRAARDLFCQTEEAMAHRRLAELTGNPDVLQAFQTALDDGARAEALVDLPQPRNGSRIFALRVSPLCFRHSAAQAGAVGIFFDITQLEHLEKVRQEFLSNVSHELRTPLTAILALVETLENGALEDAGHNRRFLSIISRNAERMRFLLEDILELSTIEAGKISLTPQKVALASLVEAVFEGLESRAEARQVVLHHAINPDLTVYADERRLEQMLTNLLDNAVKFTRPESVVTVTHNRAATHDRISVTDQGPGIAPEHLPRLFERFYRVDHARSREMGGTGLGLAIVKHLARAHDGEATVASVTGDGATFTIELPRRDAAEARL